MSDTESNESHPAAEPPWDATQVMRDRAAETRRTRDESITELRSELDDGQILDQYGIDLGEIER